MKLELYCDGASRGNPGAGAFGYVILEDGRIVSERAEILGTVTNNVAEYQGLIEGVRDCLQRGATDLTVKSDSELMVRQLNGLYKVKAQNLLPLFETARTLLQKIPQVKVLHVRREENKLADALANKALDNARH